jgi:hypothetical protein
MSADDAFIKSAFRVAIPVARNGNVVGIVVSLIAILLEDNSFWLIPMTLANVAALLFTSLFLPGVERKHGTLRAHLIFLRVNIANMLVLCCVVFPSLLWQNGLIGSQDHVGSGSPLLCASLAALYLMLVCVLHLLVCPLAYRCVVHGSLIALLLLAPSFSVLGRSQEVLFQMLGLTFGELAGRALQSILRKSIEAAQADGKALQSRLSAIDDERRSLIERLEHVDREKERLSYELALEQKRTAVRAAASSAGSNSEIAELLGAEVEASPRSIQVVEADGAGRSSCAVRVGRPGLRSRVPVALQPCSAGASVDGDDSSSSRSSATSDKHVVLSESLSRRLDVLLADLMGE